MRQGEGGGARAAHCFNTHTNPLEWYHNIGRCQQHFYIGARANIALHAKGHEIVTSRAIACEATARVLGAPRRCGGEEITVAFGMH